MKSLRESLLDDDLINKTDEYIKNEIKAFLIENYKGLMKISRNPNADGKYEVSSTSDIEVTNKNIISLTNGMFIWTTVNRSFTVTNCDYLTSLEGSPRIINEGFYCYNCLSLKTLKGAPKEVRKDFDCSGCKYLESLEGAPKEVGKDFNCDYNKSLKSLEGAPKKVDGYFCCHKCVGQFTEDDVKKISNVKGKIKC